MKDPRFAHMRRALDEVRRGRRTLVDVLGLSSRDIPQLARFGLYAHEHADHETAIACGTLVVTIDATAIDGWLLIAVGHASMHLSAPAMRAYEQVLLLDPRHMRALVDLSELRLADLNFAGAADTLQRAIAQDRSAQTPLGLRAQMLVVQTLQTHGVQ